MKRSFENNVLKWSRRLHGVSYKDYNQQDTYGITGIERNGAMDMASISVPIGAYLNPLRQLRELDSLPWKLVELIGRLT
jgi:hypothetical protein